MFIHEFIHTTHFKMCPMQRIGIYRVGILPEIFMSRFLINYLAIHLLKCTDLGFYLQLKMCKLVGAVGFSFHSKKILHAHCNSEFSFGALSGIIMSQGNVA